MSSNVICLVSAYHIISSWQFLVYSVMIKRSIAKCKIRHILGQGHASLLNSARDCPPEIETKYLGISPAWHFKHDNEVTSCGGLWNIDPWDSDLEMGVFDLAQDQDAIVDTLRESCVVWGGKSLLSSPCLLLTIWILPCWFSWQPYGGGLPVPSSRVTNLFSSWGFSWWSSISLLQLCIVLEPDKVGVMLSLCKSVKLEFGSTILKNRFETSIEASRTVHGPEL